MLKNYLKIVSRSFFKQKTFSLINLSGLAIGVAAFLLVLLWIQDEINHNLFHTNVDQLYQVFENQQYEDNNILTTAVTPGQLSKAIKEEVPEVSMTARTTWRIAKEFTFKNTTTEERGYYVDETYLDMFSFPLVEGNINNALSAPNNIVISQKMAEKYFGKKLALGETLLANNEKNYKITGILADIPSNSSLAFDYLLPFSDFEAEQEWLQYWGQNGIFTWVQLKKQADFKETNQKIASLLKNNNRQKNVELFLYPLKDLYLFSDFENGKYAGGGKIKNVRLFGTIGLLIILIACINFINLSTARSRTRAREIGVRKVIGAKRTALVLQTMSVAYTSPVTWGILLTLFISVGFLSGGYPAFVLSNFKPVETLTKRFNGRVGSDYFRKGLVVGQFAIAILLIIGTGVVFSQLRYMQHKDLGYNKEQLLYIPVKTNTLKDNYPAFKNQLEQLPEVLSVSSGSHHLSLIGSTTNSISWDGKEPDKNQMFVSFGTNFDILKTIDADLINGRDFSPSFSTDSLNFIINEAAAQAMGMEHPVGQNLSWGDEVGQIVGVVKNFHISPLKYSIDPAVMYIDPNRINHIFVKVATAEMTNTLAKIKSVFSIQNPNQTFDYQFASDEYAQFYQSEKTVSELSGICALLGIFICCLGLFGLALFTIEQRTKEIGIRKVLGASIGSIVSLLSKDFLKLVLLALTITLPFAWYFTSQWLQDFHYRIDTPWGLFLLTGALTVFIAFATVSIQSIRAALVNPSDILKTE